MATTQEILQGIAQAAANAYDGALDDKGEPIKVGLSREEGHLIHDSRIIDGFKVKIQADKLIVLYHGDITTKDVHGGKFEDEMQSMINDVVKFLKKEYKKITGNSLTLTKDGDVDVMVQKVSNVRTFVQANGTYKIGGLKGVDPMTQSSEEKLDGAIKDWLAIGKDKYPGAKKPQNVTRK